MYVKGNPVISKMLNHCGLTSNEKGLFYCHEIGKSFEFLITDDHVKIAEIAGFDYTELESAKEYADFFKLLTTNVYFRPSRFETDSSLGGSKMLKELAEYLSANPCEKTYIKRSIEDMFSVLKEFDFESRYNKLHEVYDNKHTIHKKFNGGVVLAFHPDYDKRNLKEGFDIFNDSFDSIYENMVFLYDHTPEEITEEYLRLTDINHRFCL
jgi:hypothetical protein